MIEIFAKMKEYITKEEDDSLHAEFSKNIINSRKINKFS